MGEPDFANHELGTQLRSDRKLLLYQKYHEAEYGCRDRKLFW
jgi:hypothetical protein